MRRGELLEWVERLGREFQRRGMEEHLRPLRLYYLALRHRLTTGKLEVSWSAEHTRLWLEALRLPPFAEALPRREAGADCPRCGPEQSRAGEAIPAARRRLVFPGGARVECLGCRSAWLEPGSEDGG
jgi:hypothetical protein